jgi:hypothetical protein
MFGKGKSPERKLDERLSQARRRAEGLNTADLLDWSFEATYVQGRWLEDYRHRSADVDALREVKLAADIQAVIAQVLIDRLESR